MYALFSFLVQLIAEFMLAAHLIANTICIALVKYVPLGNFERTKNHIYWIRTNACLLNDKKIIGGTTLMTPAISHTVSVTFIKYVIIQFVLHFYAKLLPCILQWRFIPFHPLYRTNLGVQLQLTFFRAVGEPVYQGRILMLSRVLRNKLCSLYM